MRPPRHHPSGSDDQQQRTEGSQSQAETSPPSLGMSPASRYKHNLKVLRRRDPSIISIFDQFSHVCVYHHDGKKWEKHGYEGSMFLFERDVYPPYGFYVLNRMGMEDYIQHIYPEDVISAHGSYLIIRSYPDFMATRLAGIQAKLELESGTPLPDKFADVYKIEGVEDLDPKMKGRSSIVGLWMFATDARESMIEVMRRLHSFIVKNVPYPEEFRYGPVRPPPPHRLRAVTKASSSQYGTSSDASDSQASHSDSEHSSAGAVSEVDKLFAKFVPTAPPPPTASSSTMTFPTSTSSMSLESLFAALGGPEIVGPAAPTPLAPSIASASTSTSTTGINLLDTIFASASNVSVLSHQPQHQQQGTPRKIFSPTPSTSTSTSTLTTATSPPQAQVLNQDVISTLLGLPPSRTASAASSSHPSSREGDNEDEEEEDGGRGSPASARGGREYSGNGLLSVLGGHGGGVRNGKVNVNGDVTPRAFLNGRCHFGMGVPTVIEATSSVATIRGLESSSLEPSAHMDHAASTHQNVNVKPRANRELVPFEADSELWPYPSPQAQGGQQAAHAQQEEGEQQRHDSGDEDDADIVELDFEDTSVLSDLDAFKRAARAQRGWVASRKDASLHVASSPSLGLGEGSISTREKGKGKKKARKERDARERDAIEKSWDVPDFCSGIKREQGVVQQDRQGMGQQPRQVKTTTTTRYLTQAVTSPPASPSAGMGQQRQQPQQVKTTTTTTTRYLTQAVTSPPASPSPPLSPSRPDNTPQMPVYTPPRSVHTPPRSVYTPQMRVHTPPRSVHTPLGPVHTPSPRRIPSSDTMTPTMTGKTNGAGGKGRTLAPMNGSAAKLNVNGNGHVERNGHVGAVKGNGHVDVSLVRGSIVAAMNAQPGVVAGMERNEFVREVLTLIHTDRAFVDTLWQEYLARLQ